MTTVRDSGAWLAAAALMGTLVGGSLTACETSGEDSPSKSSASSSGKPSSTKTTKAGGGGGSPVLGVDLTEGADEATRLVDAQKDLARVCPTPNCVKLDVTVDPGPDEEESDECEVLSIDHPKPLRAGDRVAIVINRPCDQEEPDPPTQTATTTKDTSTTTTTKATQ